MVDALVASGIVCYAEKEAPIIAQFPVPFGSLKLCRTFDRTIWVSPCGLKNNSLL